ncbi:MAG: sulfonate transporter substrate-binding protein [Microvirga sp.]|jgi:NitT/TauT family transport system substrate-binding protein|nr:sulfonate transporter substrate-binding protein [Microvirga sp.]
MPKLARVVSFALGALLLLTGIANAADTVSLRLNWYLGGLHAPFYYGKEKGYFAKEGIDLTINEGRGSVAAAQAIAAGSDTFGMADAGTLMLTASKGAEIKAVMSLLNTSGFGIISLEETGIKSPADLQGKRLAITAGDALTQLFPALAKANSIDTSKVTLVQMDPAAKVVAVLEKRVDALLGGIDDQFFLIEQKGPKAAALRFADHGANTVGITIISSEATIKSKPDLVKRFVAAATRSWEEAKKSPEAAVDAALKVKPDLNKESTLKQLKVDLDLLDTVATKGKGVGFAADGDWETTKRLLTEYRDLKTDKPASAFYTNEFLPQ